MKDSCRQVHRLRYLIRCDFNHRSSIFFSRINEIVGKSKKHDGTSHQAAKVHMRRIRVDCLRKEAEDEDNNTITNAKGIQKDAPNTGDMEGAPDELISMPGGAGHLAGVTDGSSDAVPEEQGLGENIRCVKAADADRDDVVERGCRADVDQANSARNAGHDHDGIQWDSGAFLYLKDCVSPFVV